MKILGTKAPQRLLKCIFGGLAALSASAYAGNSAPSANGTMARPAMKTRMPTDYVQPYRVVGGSAYTVASVSSTTISQLVSGEVVNAATIYDGEYRQGVVHNLRPAIYVYFQNGQWWRQSLRTNRLSQSATATAFGLESQWVCDGFTISKISDWRHPENSLITYFTAGSDFQCKTGDDERHALSLSATTSTPAAAVQLFRGFYDASGAITGALGFANEQLLLFDPTLTFGPKVLLGGLKSARNAGAYARTSTATYVLVRAADNTNSVYRVDGNGTINGPLLASTVVSLTAGYADSEALYIPALEAQIIRIPFDTSQPQRVIYAGSVYAIVGITDQSVVAAVDTTSGGTELISIEKTSGSSVKSLVAMSGDIYQDIACDLNNSINETSRGCALNSFVTGNSIYWTANDGYDENGLPIDSRAGISLDNGSIIEQYDHAVWFGQRQYSTQFNTAGNSPTDGALLVKGYTGVLDVSGFQGGAVVDYDLDQGTQTVLGTVSGAGAFPAELIDSVAVLPFQYMPSTGRTDTDVYVFDAVSKSMVQLTDTSSLVEVVP